MLNINVGTKLVSMVSQLPIVQLGISTPARSVANVVMMAIIHGGSPGRVSHVDGEGVTKVI